MRSFLITGLARSRTKWLSDYFTQAGAPCLHEAFCYSSDDVVHELISAGVGISDTGLWLSLIDANYSKEMNSCLMDSDIPIVFIDRPLDEISSSLAAIDLQSHFDNMPKFKFPDRTLIVAFNEINERIEEIHRHCTAVTFNEEFADMFCNIVVKQDQFYTSDNLTEKFNRSAM